MKPKRWTFKVPCGEGEHEVTVTINKRGDLEISSPCQLLPETARKLAGSSCVEISLERIFETIVKRFKELNQKRSIRDKKELKDAEEMLVKVGIALMGSSDDYIRYRTIRELGENGVYCAVGLLVKALGNDRYWLARFAAADALGKIGDGRVVEPLVKALRDDECKWVRYASAKALGKIKDPKAIEALIEASGDEDEHVREAAKDALFSVREPSQI